MTKPFARLRDVDIARALAILMVVTSHVAQWFMKYEFTHFSGSVSWGINTVVRYLDITLFMFVAGIVLARQNKEFRGLSDYGRFEGRKFCRIMLPYLVVSLAHVAIKVFILRISPPQLYTELVAIVIRPKTHLWFLYVLMIIFLVWPLLLRSISTSALPLLLGFLLVLAVVPLPASVDEKLLSFQRARWFLPIFGLGYWYGKHALGQRHYGLLAIIIAALMMTVALLCRELVPWPETYLSLVGRKLVQFVGNVSGALFMLWFCGILTRSRGAFIKRLEAVGLRSYDIYLLHVAFVGQPLCVVLYKLHPDLAMTYVFAFVVLTLTLIGSYYLGKAIRRLPPLAFVMLGVPVKNPRK